MERLVLEFVCRTTLVAASAGLVLALFRIRSAAAQHAMWTGVLAAMLVLPFSTAWAPRAPLRILPASSPASIEVSAPPEPARVTTTSTGVATPSSPPAHSGLGVRDLAFAVYLLGASILLFRLAVGTLRARRLTCASCFAPITVGFFRPRILLPAGFEDWPASHREAVLAHEQAHAERHDPMVQWLALLNRALFWFHPLAWWLERRLTSLAEASCDAAVLRRGCDAAGYSALLLELARTVQQSGARLHVAGTPMPGSHLSDRLRGILSGAVTARVSPARLTAAVLACAACTLAFAAGRLERSSRLTLLAPQVVSTQPGSSPKFEVASIHPCKPSDITEGGRGGGKRGGPGGRFRESPGAFTAECQTVENMIRWAYLGYPDGKPWPIEKGSGMPIQPIPMAVFRQEIRGPGWISSDRYTITAKASEAAAMEMKRGPMLRSLLEERFHLKVRIENRDVNVYVLSRGDGELKFAPTAAGSCMSLPEFEERYPPGPRTPGVPGPRVCGPFHASVYDRNPNLDRETAHRTIGVETYGQTMDGLVRQFSVSAERDVVNRTGLTGIYDLHLEIAMEDLFTSRASPDAAEPPPTPEQKIAHIAAAVQKLGLKLELSKAAAPFLVIEHVERPTEN